LDFLFVRTSDIHTHISVPLNILIFLTKKDAV